MPEAVSAAWLPSTLAWLCQNAGNGVAYSHGGAAASEPTALAALALASHGHIEDAKRAAAWLKREQLADGSVGVRPGEAKPAWTTSLALVAWHEINQDRSFDSPIAKATEWLIQTRGSKAEQSEDLGHDTSLIGWSWAENTHSWLEPTAFAVLALNAAGKADHPRTKEALRLLENRLLDSGGCNYGNTTVFGRELRAHVQPTGIVLLALAAQGGRSAKVSKAIEWLQSKLNADSTPASLAWGLMGLKAHSALPSNADTWLAAAAQRVMQRDNSPAKLAVLALADSGWPAARGNP